MKVLVKNFWDYFYLEDGKPNEEYAKLSKWTLYDINEFELKRKNIIFSAIIIDQKSHA